MSIVDYNDINFCLNTLYNAIYKGDVDRYRFEHILRKNITISDLKKPSSYDGADILTNLSYIGYFNDRFHFKRKGTSEFPCQVSFGIYQNNNINLSSGALYNIAMMYMISEMIYIEKFKFSMLPIMLFDISHASLFMAVPNFQELAAKNNIAYDTNTKFYCLVTEHYFRMLTLREYIKENKNEFSLITWKTLFFQVLYALAKLTERFKNFRHNKLNLDAIRVYINKPTSNATYKLGDTNFVVPDSGFTIKLTDYDISTTDDYLKNTSFESPSENSYFDVHYFFNYLLLWLKTVNIDLPEEAQLFVSTLIPDKLFYNDYSSFSGLNENDDTFMKLPPSSLIPAMILKKNNFFGEFINSTMDLSVSPVDEKTIKKEKLNQDEMSSLTSSSSEEKPRMLAKNMGRTSKMGRRTIEEASSKADKQRNKRHIVSQTKKKHSKDLSSDSSGTASYAKYLDALAEVSKHARKPSKKEHKKKKKSKDRNFARYAPANEQGTKEQVQNNDIEKYFGPKLAAKIKRMPPNFVEEVPPELAARLPDVSYNQYAPAYSGMGIMPTEMMEQMPYTNELSFGSNMAQPYPSYQQLPPQLPPQLHQQLPPQMHQQLPSQQLPPQQLPPQQLPPQMASNMQQFNMPYQMQPNATVPFMMGGGKKYKLQPNFFF